MSSTTKAMGNDKAGGNKKKSHISSVGTTATPPRPSVANSSGRRHPSTFDSLRMSDASLLHDTLLAMCGLGSATIRLTGDRTQFLVSSSAKIAIADRQCLNELLATAMAYLQCKSYADNLCTRASTRGTYLHALGVALRIELTTYIQQISEIQQQVKHQGTSDAIEEDTHSGDQPILCLSDLRTRLFPVIMRIARLRYVHKLLELNAPNFNTGEMVTMLWQQRSAAFGDNDAFDLLTRLLDSVCSQYRRAIARWCCDGVINDPQDEFFIRLDTASSSMTTNGTVVSLHPVGALGDCVVCAERQPAFLPSDICHKILTCGKTIRFLRVVCRDNQLIDGMDDANAELSHMPLARLYDPIEQRKLSQLLDRVCQLSGRFVLQLVRKQFRITAHLQMIKDYILLANGDFVSTFMRSIYDELAATKDLPTSGETISKPKAKLFGGQNAAVSCTSALATDTDWLRKLLDNALRQSSVRTIDDELMNNVDVEIIEPIVDSVSVDAAWDSVMLRYKMDGPIRIIANERTDEIYARLFATFWRIRRIDFLAHQNWWLLADHVNSAHTIACAIPELKPVVRNYQLTQKELLEFLQHLKFYYNNEVLEGNWRLLQKRIDDASSLDDLVAAHDQFLDALMAETFIAEHVETIGTQLMCVLNQTITISQHLVQFVSDGHAEIEKRQQFALHQKRFSSVGSYIEDGDVISEAERVQQAVADLTSRYAVPLPLLLEQYRTCVQTLLTLLAASEIEQHRALSVRADFSGFYRRRDPRIFTGTTFARVSRHSSAKSTIMPK